MARLSWREEAVGAEIVAAAKALVYFADADAEPSPRLLKPCDWEATKAYFRREVPALMRKHLG